ncbi:MAG: serine/threonine protein kinase [Archangium sp.]|nr:serine/threonine protein kinase [Archangium sp.]
MSDDISSASTQLSDSAKSQNVTIPGAPIRSTVLPRVEWVGPEPKVKPSERQRFEELGLLGEGGMGEVLLAQDHDIDREVAVKRIPQGADLGRVLRFVEEIRTIGRLEHPNIVPVHDVGVDSAGRYFFVMKRVHGETLEQIIAKLAAGDPATHARFTMEVRTQIFLLVLCALAYAHGQGFIHRDLKPANIMIGPFGEVTVMDWGLARRVAGDGLKLDKALSSRDGTVLQTQLGAVLGTPLYMSPEQARGANDALDFKSDVYSLCVVFHEFLHLEHYLHGRTELQDVLKAVQTVSPTLHAATLKGRQYQVPAELDWFIARGLEKEPQKRWSSVGEMEEELQRIIRGECRVQCQRTFLKRMFGETRKAIDNHPVAVIVGSTGTLALFAAAIVKSVLVLTG